MTDAETLDLIWRNSWNKPDRRAPWEWCEEFVKTIPHSPKSGRFSSASSPWIREPLEEIANPRVSLISIKAAIQSGKTLFAELGIAWKAVNAPCPMLVLHQKDDDATHYFVNRLRPFLEKIKPVKKLFPLDRFKVTKDFMSLTNGASALFKGAFNKKNLQGHTIKEIWGDEVWNWPDARITEAEARVDSFDFNSLCVFYSQGGESGDDHDRKHDTTDKREWSFFCESCEDWHPFEWSRVEWSDKAKLEKGGYDYNIVRESAEYVCRCGHRYEDTRLNRKKMSRNGKYVASNPNATKGQVGFHWNSLCCKSWGYLAELYLRAKMLARTGDFEELKAFYQKRLAISWEENLESFEADIAPSNYDPYEQWEEEGIVHRRGFVTHRAEPVNEELYEGQAKEVLEEALTQYNETMRAATPLRFLAVDCQQTHFFAVARSWSASGSSRLLEWAGGIAGKPAKYPRPLLLWDDIEEMRKKWGIKPALVFVDNGFDTSNVNMECAKRGYTALQGSPRHTFAHRVTSTNKSGKKRRMNIERYYSKLHRVNLGKRGFFARVRYWSNLNIKDTLARLRGNQDPAEGATWEIFDGIEKEYLRQIDAEQRLTEDGKPPRWVLIGKRANHLLDCEAMQVVAATIIKLIGKDSNVGINAKATDEDAQESEITEAA